MQLSDYSLGLFRKWGIGDKEKHNGVLIFVVSSTKQVRIEIGYGLEGRIPDSKCGEIIRDKMKPLIDQDDFNGGILAGYRAVVDEVTKEYGTDGLASSTTTNKIQPASIDFVGWFLTLSLFIQILIIIIILLIVYIIIRMIASGGMFFFDSGSSFGSSNSDSFFDSFGGGSGGGGGGDD
jgi:uncharacterized protein